MKKYNCKSCGAELYFDAVSQKLKCEYCETAFDPKEYEGAEHKEEQKESTQARELGEYDKAVDESVGELVLYTCSHCGAEIITGETTVATTCIYCNRAVIFAGKLEGSFRPDYVIPFVKTKNDVTETYKKLTKRASLLPKIFKEESTIEELKGVYMPFWIHSMNIEGKAEVEATTRRSWTTGDRRYTETSYYDVLREGVAEFGRIPTDALKRIDNELMHSLEPFNCEGLKSFSGAYLAGYYTEQYDESAEETIVRAKKRAEECVSGLLLANATGYDTRKIKKIQYNYLNEKSEYAMFPIWTLHTKYRGKTYVFGMNGQTGKMTGTFPKDIGKMIKIVVSSFLATQIILAIVRLIGGGL